MKVVARSFVSGRKVVLALKIARQKMKLNYPKSMGQGEHINKLVIIGERENLNEDKARRIGDIKKEIIALEQERNVDLGRLVEDCACYFRSKNISRKDLMEIESLLSKLGYEGRERLIRKL